MNNARPMKQQQVTVNLDTMETIKCGASWEDQNFKVVGDPQFCDSTEFTKVFIYKKLSALVSPTGREQIVEMQVLKCMKCGAVKVLNVR